jgi:hypothetical protein
MERTEGTRTSAEKELPPFVPPTKWGETDFKIPRCHQNCKPRASRDVA